MRNPALDVPPSYCSTPSQILEGKQALDLKDKASKLVVVGGSGEASAVGSACCQK